MLAEQPLVKSEIKISYKPALPTLGESVFPPFKIVPPFVAVHWIEKSGPFDEPSAEIVMMVWSHGISIKLDATLRTGALESTGTVMLPIAVHPPKGSSALTVNIPPCEINGADKVDEKPFEPLHKNEVFGKLELTEMMPVVCWQVNVSVVNWSIGTVPMIEMLVVSAVSQPFKSKTVAV